MPRDFITPAAKQIDTSRIIEDLADIIRIMPLTIPQIEVLWAVISLRRAEAMRGIDDVGSK